MSTKMAEIICSHHPCATFCINYCITKLYHKTVYLGFNRYEEENASSAEQSMDKSKNVVLGSATKIRC